MKTWEIYDLDNDELQAAYTALVAAGEGSSSKELLEAMMKEMDERSLSFTVFAALKGEPTPNENQGGTHQQRALLSFCPPWYVLPTTAEPIACAESAPPSHVTSVKDASRYRTMWDDSSSEHSDGNTAPPTKKATRRRAAASTGRMTPQGFFVAGPVRKKKSKVPQQLVAPVKRPPLPVFGKKAALGGSSQPVVALRSCQTPPPTFTTLRGLPPARQLRARSAIPSPTKARVLNPPTAAVLPDTSNETALLLGDGDVDALLVDTNRTDVVVVSGASGLDSSATPSMGSSPPLTPNHEPTASTPAKSRDTSPHPPTPRGCAVDHMAEPGLTSTITTEAAVEAAICKFAVRDEVIVRGLGSAPDPPVTGCDHQKHADEGGEAGDTPAEGGTLAKGLEGSRVEEELGKRTPPGEEGEGELPRVFAQEEHMEYLPTVQPTAAQPPTPPPPSYGAVFPRFEDILIEPFHLRPYSELPPEVVVAAMKRFVSELRACSEECRDLDGDDPFNEFLCKVQRSRSEVYELISGCLLSSGSPGGGQWFGVDGAGWNVWWSWKRPLPQDSVWLATQLVNHIPKAAAVARKDLLKRHIQRYGKGRGAGAAAFKNVMPLTFSLPTEYVAFTECFAEVRGVWIVKTVGMSRGRGISITDSIEGVTYSDPVVVQRYVDRPLLVAPSANPAAPRTHKFDLRLYVLVTQFSPLECFISRLGFARIAGKRYNPGSLGDLEAHLTNTAVSSGLRAAGNLLSHTDTKWTLQTLERYVEATLGGGTWSAIWDRVCGRVLQSLACAEDAIPRCPCCFELFGFDVLLDEDLQAWVLEANASPAMDVECEQDEEVKPTLIREVVRLLDPLPIRRDNLLAVLTRRISEESRKRRKKPTPAEEASQRDTDLASIFDGHLPRPYGQMPTILGAFERLAPSPQYNKVTALKKSCV